MTSTQTYTLEVRGALACFTRPELKVERVSYEVITPAAARAIFEAIYWKPQMRWKVMCIEVLNPIAFSHIRRCEVSSLAHTKKEYIVAQGNRQLRSSLVLRNVRYRLTAEMEVFPFSDQPDDTPKKHYAIFERRAGRGQCFTQPYLGCREFAADWKLVATDQRCIPIGDSRNLGRMIHDMDFSNPEIPQPRFFHAVMENGVILVPKL